MATSCHLLCKCLRSTQLFFCKGTYCIYYFQCSNKNYLDIYNKPAVRSLSLSLCELVSQTYIHTHTHVYTHTHMHTYTRTYSHTYIHTVTIFLIKYLKLQAKLLTMNLYLWDSILKDNLPFMFTVC